MRLLFVSHSLPPHGRPMENVGGMQRAAIDLHDGLMIHRGIEAKAMVLRSAWSERGFRTPVFLAQALRDIRRMARARETDAILFSSMVTSALAVPLKNILRKSGIVTGGIVNGLDALTPVWPYPLLVRRTFAALDVAFPISNATGAACRPLGLADDKRTVVPLGVRLDRFAPNADKSRMRSRLLGNDSGLRGNPRIVLCSVGRLVPRKGVAWFVDNVMPRLPDDVVYFIAGEGPDRERIQQAILRNGLSQRVRMLGAISEAELELLYHGSDLFVMPNVPVANDMEGFGLVLLEAGICGLPAVASLLEGITDVVTDGENGYLVSSGDADAFCGAISRFHSDPSLLVTASERARLHTISRFGWNGVIARYVSVLEEARSGGGG